MDVAIDSLPLRKGLLESRDYSGLQLWGLCESPLAECTLPTQNDAIAWEVEPQSGLTWPCGNPITATDFLRGLNQFRVSQPTLFSILFRSLKRLDFHRGRLRWNLKQNNWQFDKILKTPLLIPIGPHGERCSGPYQLASSRGKSSYRFRKTRASYVGPEQITIHNIKSPHRNLQLFEANKLDITSDTSLPLTREILQKPNLEIHDSGLFGGIEFGPELQNPEATELRQFICQALLQVDFSDIHSNAYGRLSLDIDFKPYDLKIPPLTLAYDDFYPNFKVVQRISQSLLQFGIKTELRKDNFYSPKSNYQMKFVIKRGLGSHAYLKYLSALSYPSLRTHQTALKEYSGLYRAWERGDIEDSAAESLLRKTLYTYGVFAELFKIPSMALNRSGYKNPLIRHLVT